ncbi:restriction endonuclease subunit S [Bifidobacterium bifidum]|uniref:restriction endonuclease subunit S n=2 Tax=Bifidobacterium bifidum TaxID=1681 RepID=UPI0018997079|nr:restriction endonuclease subunit S [Bifidobacterium bifidum]MDB1254922.1 restriction endonuclease subunit S [Bifidobacterium bifidum]
MAEQAKVPAIRFAGFTDPWEQRKLGEVATIVGGGTPSTNNDAYWDGDIDWYSPAELGEQVYAERSARRITQAGYDSCSATLLPAGKTILFTSRAGIGNTAILRRSACTNQGFQSLVVNDDTDVYFVYSMTDRIKKFAERKASGSTFLEISGKGLAAGEFAFPSKDEQTAIGSMFKQLDFLITLHQRKYDKLVVFKKSMLEKMFPKDGESVPEIRFAGFTDPWEQRKLGELSSEFQSGDFISAEKILASGPYPVYGGNGLRGYAKRYNHDGFYALIGRQGALCGNVNTAVGKAYFTEHAVAIKANSLHDTRFLVHLLRCMDLGQYSGQSAQPGLAVGVLKEVETTVPSKVEQQAIGSFFSRLDDLITLHQRKLELLQNIKKSLLDKMFV